MTPTCWRWAPRQPGFRSSPADRVSRWACPRTFADRLSGAAGGWAGQAGRGAALAGSCSAATRTQVARHAGPTFEVAPDALMAGGITAEDAAAWALAQEGLPLVTSSADPEAVRAAQSRHGAAALAEALESFFAGLARALVAGGVTRLTVAGGETSGAVVEALAPPQLAIGPEIDPGVPALRAGDDLVLALKSGNFGAQDFFAKADAVLEGRQ